MFLKKINTRNLLYNKKISLYNLIHQTITVDLKRDLKQPL